MKSGFLQGLLRCRAKASGMLGSGSRVVTIGCLVFIAGLAVDTHAATATSQPAVKTEYAGKVELVEGDARIVALGQKPRPAKVGDLVNQGDTLITGKDGEIHLAMQDAGFIALRPGTQFSVISYHADADDKDNGIFGLLSGGFRSVTGWIGKFNRPSYQVRTPTATIGIRGTDHEPRYIPEGSSEGPAGTYDKVYAGESYIKTAQGEAAINPDQAGFVASAEEEPRRLDQVPGFFRPGRHETYIARKHEEIQAIIVERREARRKFMAERREELAARRAEKNEEQIRNDDALDQRLKESGERHRELQEERKAAREERKAERKSRSGD